MPHDLVLFFFLPLFFFCVALAAAVEMKYRRTSVLRSPAAFSCRLYNTAAARNSDFRSQGSRMILDLQSFSLTLNSNRSENFTAATSNLSG